MTRVINLLLIDNGDDFTAGLAGACRSAGATVEIVGNRRQARDCLAYALQHDALIMLSPGPGGPREAGCCLDLIALAAGRVPLIGVCLGHQAIVAHHGGHVVRAHEASQGKSSAIEHDGAGAFADLASPMRVGRYHSLCTPLNAVPPSLHVHAVLDGMAMAVSHAGHGQLGLQFHPESVLTPMGARLIERAFGWAAERRAAFGGLTVAAAAGKIAA